MQVKPFPNCIDLLATLCFLDFTLRMSNVSNYVAANIINCLLNHQLFCDDWVVFQVVFCFLLLLLMLMTLREQALSSDVHILIRQACSK